MNMKTIRYFVGAILLLAIADLPYGYYTLLRIIVTIVAGITAFIASEQENQFWMILFGAIAILFNPIIPIYLDKDVWVVIDVIVAVLFGISTFTVKTEDDL